MTENDAKREFNVSDLTLAAFMLMIGIAIGVIVSRDPDPNDPDRTPAGTIDAATASDTDSDGAADRTAITRYRETRDREAAGQSGLDSERLQQAQRADRLEEHRRTTSEQEALAMRAVIDALAAAADPDDAARRRAFRDQVARMDAEVAAQRDRLSDLKTWRSTAESCEAGIHTLVEELTADVAELRERVNGLVNNDEPRSGGAADPRP